MSYFSVKPIPTHEQSILSSAIPRASTGCAATPTASVYLGAIVTSWAAPTTSAPAASRGIQILGINASPFRSNGYWQSLQNCSLVVAGRIHAIVDGKIAADQVSAHGCVLASKQLASIGCISLIFAVVDTSHTSEAGARAVELIMRFGPLPAAAQT